MPLGQMVERFSPIVIGVASTSAFGAWGKRFFEQAARSDWGIEALYSAVFDTSALICAFLFSFLIFVKTTENKVLFEFRRNAAYKVMERDFIKSILASFLLAILSAPLMVLELAPVARASIGFWAVSAWVGLFGYTIAATFRSGYQFIAVLDAAYSKRFEQK